MSYNRWSRRRVLVATGGTAVLAGCSTDDDSASNGQDDGSENGADDSEPDEDGPEADGSEPDENDTDEDELEPESDEDSEPDEDDSEADEDSEVEEPDLSEFTLRVVDANGEPAEAMLVVGEGEPHEADIPLEFTGVTGSEGYHHNRIYENEYTIEIDHPDYEGTTIEHSHDGPSEVTVELDVVVDDSAEGDSAEDDDPTGAEEPDHAELVLRAVDPDGDPIQGAVVRGEGEPHEADIPLEFTGITGGDGYHYNLIYENEYSIEIDHSDYEPTTVEHTHDGDHELTVELEPE
ncbi:hypothetical protein [Natronococcus occultus]|uniref:Uncharacterized protein n=1 Tax=Natronococcus occultus SP4 TaxID=694430 RepID=L0JUL1_9EURY|nr:hypothetical protein [Natronococcus occultus]AGB36717.1 hypothetical protein Natoc_0868 [Natronococcus occultus SP4]